MHGRTFTGLIVMACIITIVLPLSVMCCYFKKGCGLNQDPPRVLTNTTFTEEEPIAPDNIQ